MPYSSLGQLTLNCPQCGVAFEPQLWLIIDTDRPDLLERLRDGTLYQVACPNGHAGVVDAPLLLVRPEEQPPLLFSPAERTSAELDRVMARGLIERLAAMMGDDWREEWAAGLTPVPRRLLVEALGSVDAAATIDRALAEAMPPGVGDVLGKLATLLTNEGVRLDSAKDLEEALAARPELRERFEVAVRDAGAPASPRPADEETGRPPVASPDSLLTTLRGFVEAETWLDSYRFVRDHPELLTDAAEARLAGLAARAAAVEEKAVAGLFAEHLALLRRARAVGVLPAFAEKMGVAPEVLGLEAERGAPNTDAAHDTPII